MTNYNERLDEALALIKYSVEYRETHGGCPPKVSAIKRHGVAEARQAITLLIKELVAEAKPLLKERTASTEFTTWDRKTKVVKTFESETDPGFNKAINEFEQNLLKALEEKK